MALDVKITKQLNDFKLELEFKSFNERISILGVSGAGKSMALKCIAGLETPDYGHIILNDKCLFDSNQKINLSPQERKVGYLFQQYALFPHMSVYENIEFVCKDKAKITKYISMFQLEGLETQLPKNISGGQKQRVALARMFAYEPDVLLLDEPFSALDSHLKDRLYQELLLYLDEFKSDVIIVTHDKDEAFALCEKMIVLKNGKNLSNALDVVDLYKKPNTIAIAKILGCRNFSCIEIIDSYTINAIDWGIIINLKDEVPLYTTHIGLYDTSFTFSQAGYKIIQNSIISKATNFDIKFMFKEDKEMLNYSCLKQLYIEGSQISIIENELLFFNESNNNY